MGGLHQEIGEMRRDMVQLRQEVHRDIRQFHQEMGEMRADVAVIRTVLAPRDPLDA